MSLVSVLGYFDRFGELVRTTVVTDQRKRIMEIDAAIAWVQDTARRTHEAGNKLIFVGNGGSAAIASHMAIDFSKNGNMRALALNDPMALTCLGNDLGYENVFSKQIDLHARAGDLLIVISSSGRSPNVVKAAEMGRARGCKVATLSGFTATNPLRRLGDINFYVPNSEYGFVEIMHLALCHCVLDLAEASVRPERAAASRPDLRV